MSAPSDPLKLLIKALSTSSHVKLYSAAGNEVFNLPECETLGFPAQGNVKLPKTTLTRYRRSAAVGGTTATASALDATTYYDLQSLLFAFMRADAAGGEYVKEAYEAGISFVPLVERRLVVDLLKGTRPEGPEVDPVAGSSTAAANSADPSAPQSTSDAPIDTRPAKKARYVVNKDDQRVVADLLAKQEKNQLIDSATVLRGAKPTDFTSVLKLVEDRVKAAREDLKKFEKGGSGAQPSASSANPYLAGGVSNPAMKDRRKR